MRAWILDIAIILFHTMKSGQSYSIVVNYVKPQEKERITKLILSDLKNEYKPNQIFFLNKHFQFRGIKPSRDELLNILKKDLYIYMVFLETRII